MVTFFCGIFCYAIIVISITDGAARWQNINAVPAWLAAVESCRWKWFTWQNPKMHAFVGPPPFGTPSPCPPVMRGTAQHNRPFNHLLWIVNLAASYWIGVTDTNANALSVALRVRLFVCIPVHTGACVRLPDNTGSAGSIIVFVFKEVCWNNMEVKKKKKRFCRAAISPNTAEFIQASDRRRALFVPS